MTAQEVIVTLLTVLFGDRRKDPPDRGLVNHLVDGRPHTPGCPYGQWLRPGDSLLGGSPCSDRCLRAWEALRQAITWLDEHPLPDLDRQGSLFEEVAP